MSLVSVIARKVARSLKFGSRPTEPDYRPNEYVKLRHTKHHELAESPLYQGSVGQPDVESRERKSI